MGHSKSSQKSISENITVSKQTKKNRWRKREKERGWYHFIVIDARAKDSFLMGVRVY